MKTTQSNCLKFRLFIEISNHNKSYTFPFFLKKKKKAKQILNSGMHVWDDWPISSSLYNYSLQLSCHLFYMKKVEQHIISGCKTLVVGKPKKSNKCSLKTCRQHGLMPFLCPDCRKNHCIRWEIFDWHLHYEKKSFFFPLVLCIKHCNPLNQPICC